MNPKFPLTDVTIRQVESTRKLENPLYADSYWQINQHEFALQVEGVGSFYACNGNEIEYSLAPESALASIELYLNGSVYGAILHQRNILPLHGSCFTYKNQGIMVCGESGAGKSSLTAAFCLNGSEFLTDDVTPVLFREGKPLIWAMSDRIKLWRDSLEQLKQEWGGLNPIEQKTEKFYYPMDSQKGKIFPLHQIFVLEIYDLPEVKFQDLTGIEKFTAIRNEIYRWEYLQGMSECEAGYFKQIICISKEVKVTKVLRHSDIVIKQFCCKLEEYIHSSNP